MPTALVADIAAERRAAFAVGHEIGREEGYAAGRREGYRAGFKAGERHAMAVMLSGDNQHFAELRRLVAGHFGVHERSLIARARNADIARPRMVAMYLARELTARSFPEIGRRFGGRDHTTAMHACRTVAARIAADPEFAADVEMLRAAALLLEA